MTDRVPGVAVEVDPAHGARVTSIRDATGFEWLWSRPDPRRFSIKPGDDFVDAGGAEECFPTIAGTPDHGDVWSRPWRSDGARAWFCRLADCRITRSHRVQQDTIVFDYRLDADPGYQFIWAFHALVRPDPETMLALPAGSPVVTWPSAHDDPTTSRWPYFESRDLSDLSVTDGSARFFFLPALDSATIRHGSRALTLTLYPGDLPYGIGVWRNLGGYGPGGEDPYRSLGIEPMLGHNPDRNAAEPVDVAVVPAAGRVEWQLHVSATSERAPLPDQDERQL